MWWKLLFFSVYHLQHITKSFNHSCVFQTGGLHKSDTSLLKDLFKIIFNQIKTDYLNGTLSVKSTSSQQDYPLIQSTKFIFIICVVAVKPSASKLTQYIWGAVFTGQSSELGSTHPQKTKQRADKCVNRDNQWPLHIVVESLCEIGQHFSSRASDCRWPWVLSSLFTQTLECAVCASMTGTTLRSISQSLFSAAF